MNRSQRQPNHRLAALMREARVSNKGLAKRMRDLSCGDNGDPISPAHTNVAKWLNGEIKRPAARTCQVMAKVLSELLGRPLTMHDIGYPDTPPERVDTTLEYPATVAHSITALTQLTDYELRPSDRRAALHVVPQAWAELLVKAMYSTDGHGPPPSEPRPINAYDVQSVRDATEMFANFDYRYGGGQPSTLVATFLERSVLPLLPQVSPESSLGREYFQAVAALTRLAGWTAYDTGEHALAQRYLYQAFRLARAAADKPLCGRTLAGMSHQANFLGYYEHAVHLARAASHGAQGFATPTAMALFSAMEARGLASLGNEPEATHALAAAEAWFGQRNPEDDPDWLHYFDEAELHAEFAHSFRDLGKAELANHHAAAAVAGAEDLYVRSISFCRSVLATSHLQANDLDQAVTVAQGVIDTAAHLNSYRVISYLSEFAQRLAQAGDLTVVRSFRDYAIAKLGSEHAPVTERLLVA